MEHFNSQPSQPLCLILLKHSRLIGFPTIKSWDRGQLGSSRGSKVAFGEPNAMEHNEGTFSTLSWTCKLQMWNNLDLSTLAQWEWYARGASCATERGGSNAPSLCTKLLLWPGFLGPYVVPTMTCQVRRVSFYLCQRNPPPTSSSCNV